MVPVITAAMGGGYVIYMRPTFKQSLMRLNASHGTQYDHIERKPVTGGLPAPMERINVVYPTREAAEQSIKLAA